MPRKPDVPCASCGRLLWRGRTSLPPGQATCHPCRRSRPKIVTLKPERLRAAMERASSKARGYGYEHKKLRKYLIANFVEGTPCARCDRPMYSTDPMDLDHSDDRARYLGLSHATCNRARRPVGRISFGTHDCPICGTHGVRGNQKTCSRACGVEWRRIAA
jgi:endogenous inhibitor of DNA gyrase (YacG/DUF329 family)